MSKSKLPAIKAVTVEELIFAQQVGGLAGAGRIPNSGVGGMGLNLVNDDGDVTEINLSDIPFNRAMIAIRDQFPEGMLLPLMTRIMALHQMAELPEAAPYIREAEDGSGDLEISEALMRVAARMPLNKKMVFARKQFFQQVAREFEKDPD
jgi:hypothetical protein